MMDYKYIREHFEAVERNHARRGKTCPPVKDAVALIERRVTAIRELDEKRTAAKVVAAQTKDASKDERAVLVARGKELKGEIKQQEEELSVIERELKGIVRQYPNMLRDDVPDGTDASSNEVVRTWGKPAEHNFEPKDHLALGEALGILDMDRAAKVSGSRFTYLLGDGVRLELALITYAFEKLTARGFTPVIPPHIISTHAMGAMGYLEHGGEEEIYHLKHDDAVLIGTSEQAIGPMHMDEILDGDTLPRRYAGFSPCYRREAGSYGKDVRGILRVHQFDKIEMFSFVSSEQSDTEHEMLLSVQEELMQGLQLPYRVLKLCAGETGAPSARTYDVETWIPSQNQYRETHSTSNTTDFQTRRLNTRVKRKEKMEFAHALNGTAFAIGRMLIAILENGQQADGSVIIPEVLRPFMSGQERLKV
ncbi:MAG: serine--tRNA ligase [Patescibacteria group bacterium]